MPTPNEEFSELLVQMMAVHGSVRVLWVRTNTSQSAIHAGLLS
jgi:hypothetical protein